jgi:hypothetical protein
VTRRHSLTAILPCNDLDASEAFYARLGFTHREGDDGYRMLSDGRGGELHLNAAVEGWLVPGRNPFGLYLYAENVDELAARMGCYGRGQAVGNVRVRAVGSRRDSRACRLAEQIAAGPMITRRASSPARAGSAASGRSDAPRRSSSPDIGLFSSRRESDRARTDDAR